MQLTAPHFRLNLFVLEQLLPILLEGRCAAVSRVSHGEVRATAFLDSKKRARAGTEKNKPAK
jgi:hypothetical protein